MERGHPTGPVKTAAATTRDDSASGVTYSQGYAWEGYGTGCLEALREGVVAVYGQVRDEKGNPLARAEVCAWKGEWPLACVQSDSQARYRMSHRLLPAGGYSLGAAMGGKRQPVETKDGSATRLDIGG